MPTPLENELGLGPVVHRMRRWSRNMVSRIGKGGRPEDQRLLDPLTVNYAAWHEVRRTIREWPHYKEAANSIEILVSPEDWDEYWGIDAARKESGVASYIRARAAEKGYWIAGDPQVYVEEDDAVEPGEVEVLCQFVEPIGGASASPASSTAEHPAIHVPEQGSDAAVTGVIGDSRQIANEVSSTVRFVDAKKAGEICLSDDGGFRLNIQSGDIIGAVKEDDYVPPEVNVRLDAAGFPYADTKQCQIGVIDGRWMITSFAEHGTMLVKRSGQRLMLGIPEPYPLDEGDVVYLGPERPLRVEYV